jgi:hypothetical protein
MRMFRWLFGRGSARGAGRKGISPAHLPPDLHYIIPLAERHGSDARVHAFDPRLGRHVSYAEKLSPSDIESLRALYVEIRAKGHGLAINRWHDAKGENACPPETTFPVYGLLCLFAQLGDLGVPPFDDGAVRPMEAPLEDLDWNKLPGPLRYLAGPAEVYGGYQFDERIMDFLQSRMLPEERSELLALGLQYRRDSEAINHWLDEYPMTKHPEARLVYFTGHLLGLGEDAGLL